MSIKSLFGLLLISLLISCDQSQEDEMNKAKIRSLIESTSPIEKETFSFDKSENIEIVTKDSVFININWEDLEIDEANFSGKINVKFTNYPTNIDMFFGGLKTVADTALFESGGSFNLEVFDGTTPVNLKEGKTASIQYPVNGTPKKMDLHLYDETGNWVKTNVPVEQRTIERKDTITKEIVIARKKDDPLYYTRTDKVYTDVSIQVTDLDFYYVNLSKLNYAYFDYPPKSQLTFINITPNFDLQSNYDVHILFKKFNAIQNYWITKESLVQGIHNTSNSLPLGAKATVLVFSVKGEDFLFEKKDIKIEEGLVLELNPKKMSKEKIQRQLRSLKRHFK
ncbi:hypothetical protein [Flammeovirga sp. EKP202]|uniref:hypothetical protein n=1 Tax=Flammeovirga sp. EKP202 TaxID=2770592 RepID=UPI00165FED9A|nr:hypothetical protein [Flammeovirga sp. EKP202]MBD0402630.1 hypothetical protein [Flammeovirga sp. EKP202]